MRIMKVSTSALIVLLALMCMLTIAEAIILRGYVHQVAQNADLEIELRQARADSVIAHAIAQRCLDEQAPNGEGSWRPGVSVSANQ